jgi:transcriptional regulator with XRE-family HTH domain
MLSLVKIEKIEWLLRSTDLSQRQVAMRVGVSRGSVAAIARGKRSA